MIISDIVSKIYKDTKTDSVAYPAADMLIEINAAMDRVTSLIIKADNKWQWDDSNQTDLPVATTALVLNQKDYTLSTSHLKITRMRVLDSSGTWHVLIPIDQADQDYSDREDSTTTGLPIYYDKSGNSVFLSPIPNYSQLASLEITFQRQSALFTSGEVSTGTKSPGFNPLYHVLVPLWVTYNYWLVNDQSLCNGFMKEIMAKEDALTSDYNMRGKDDIFRMTPLRQNNK